MTTATRLLIIDDDRALCELLTDYLGSAGFVVDAAYDGNNGVQRALNGKYAIVVLDLMLPGIDGLEVLRRIRAQSQLPVLMLTARGEDVDRIVGLEIGADDYLPKPFNPRELTARLHAILRRATTSHGHPAGAQPGAPVAVDDVELDPAAQRVRRGGQVVELTGTEFAMLELLLRCAGRIVGREELSQQILRRPLEPFDRSVDMHVSHLRKKLGPSPVHGERIRGIRGTGYIYVMSTASQPSAGATSQGAVS